MPARTLVRSPAAVTPMAFARVIAAALARGGLDPGEQQPRDPVGLRRGPVAAIVSASPEHHDTMT